MSRLPIITLPIWLAAAATAATGAGSAKIVAIGSSTTQGVNASTRSRRYTNLLDTKLRLRNPLAVDTHDFYNISAENSNPTTGLYSTTGTVTQDFQGLGSQTYQLAQSATMSLTATCRRFTIFFVEGSSYGPFSYQVDGGSSVVVTPSSTGTDNRHTGVVVVDALTSASHTLKVTADHMCKINGFETHSGAADKGFYVYNSGIGGAVAGDYSFRIPWLMPRLNQMAPDLIMYMVGSNDYATQVDIATYTTNVQSFITGIRNSVSSNPDILIIQPYKRLDVTNPTIPWTAYGVAQQAIATTNAGVYYLDISAPYPDSQAVDQPDLISGDSIHQTDAGYSLMARLLYPTLI